MPVSPVSIPSPGLISGEEASSPNHFAILAGPAVPLCLFFTASSWPGHLVTWMRECSWSFQSYLFSPLFLKTTKWKAY